MSYAWIQSAIGTLYTSSAPDAGRTDEALYGMKVEILETDSKTNRVFVRTHYRYQGWISQDQLYPENAQTEDWETHAQVCLQHPYADVLAEPRIQALPLVSLTRGARLQRLSETPDAAGWVAVKLLDGRVGYLREHFLAPYIPPRAVSTLQEDVFRRAVTETAKSYLGTQYRWGGKSPLGIDCSGLCSMAYMLNGILIYRDASMPEGFPVHPILREEVKPGDLFYFPGHIAMSLGGDLFIHSTSMGGYFGVVINSFDPTHPHFRPDLLAKLKECGSIF